MSQLTLIKTKPELVKVQNRSVSPYGYRHALVQDHLEDHLTTVSTKWCTIECLARTMLGRNSEYNRKQIRQRIGTAFRWFLAHGMFLVIDYEPFGKGHHGEAKAIKIFQPSDEPTAEKQFAKSQLERMLRRKEISEARYTKAMEILS